MRLADFSYDLPESLIAQEAPADRSSSRLLVVDRDGNDDPADATFRDLPNLLDERDIVVVNRSRVLPARLHARRASGARVEVLFIRRVDGGRFIAWVRGLAKLKRGERLSGEGGGFVLHFVEPVGDREAVMEFERTADADTLDVFLKRHGHVPLPPYIRREDKPEDRDRYQTVFAEEDGSIAAPTAGLHFDDATLTRLETRGTEVLSLVLHVGPGTFSPLEHAVVEDNDLHGESYTIAADALARIAIARAAGRRIVAVGTTVTRALESAHAAGWLEAPGRDRAGETNLFIYPGYKFRVVDRLITNFHLPQSSLLLLVSAFLGRERTLECYRAAVARRYRFYSYGDAMLIR
jgi:S-adenosylmethionine:tRNA ribosyltransferase-isomerase